MEKIYDLQNYFYHYEDNIESKELLEFRLPKTDISKDTKFLFHITETNAKILLSESFVKLKWKILKRNGDSIDKENVTAVCGLNPFKSKKLTIGKTTVEHVDGYFDIIQHVKRLIEYTPEYLTSQPTDMFVYLDSNDTTDRKKFIIQDDGTITDQTLITALTNKLKVIENENYNEGFEKRCKLTEDSKTVTILIPLSEIFDFIEAYPKIFTDFEIKIEFERNSDENMLYTNEKNDYKVEFEDLSLLLTHVQLKNNAEEMYNKLLLSDHPISIKWNHYEISRTNRIDRDISGTYQIPALSDEVLTLIVIPQYFDRSENYKENNMIFDNLDMVECWYSINGIPKPSEHYKMEFTNGEWNRPFEELLKKLIINKNTETAALIDYLKFAKLYPIITFDLSNHENYTSLNNLRITFHYKLKKQTNKEYVFYFITEVRKNTTLNMKKKTITMINSLA